MRTANPMLRAETFDVRAEIDESKMTITGTVNKTAVLVLLVFTSAMWAWNRFPPHGALAGDFYPWLMGGVIGGLVLAIVTSMKPVWAFWSAPVYALCEGVVLGGLSALLERSYPGIAVQATGITTTTLLALLAAYKSGLIRATENFKLGVTAATGGICLMYVASWILGMFGVSLPFLHGNGLLSIGVSVFICVIAALNLVLDFDFIEQGQAKGAPKHMEWYGAFGLLVTLVWLYLEILRLLAKLNSRD